MLRHLPSLLLVLPLTALAQPQVKASPGAYVIRAAHMIDGRSDAIQNDVSVIIEGMRITAVGASSQLGSRIPAGAKVIDLGTEGAMYADVDVKMAIARGVIPGPRMFIATRVTFVMKEGTVYKQ